MKQDLPSYIANDAAPLFPDLSAMSDKEFDNYESPPERLAFYQTKSRTKPIFSSKLAQNETGSRWTSLAA
jgi:hypothetical protein